MWYDLGERYNYQHNNIFLSDVTPMTDLAWIHKLGKSKVFKTQNMRYDVQATVLHLSEYTTKHNIKPV
jgi:hypothetical protein